MQCAASATLSHHTAPLYLTTGAACSAMYSIVNPAIAVVITLRDHGTSARSARLSAIKPRARRHPRLRQRKWIGPTSSEKARNPRIMARSRANSVPAREGGAPRVGSPWPSIERTILYFDCASKDHRDAHVALLIAKGN